MQLNKLIEYFEWTWVDLGIPKCAITSYPNKSKLNSQAFKTHVQTTNMNYRNQPIPVFDQHEPYVISWNLPSSWTIMEMT